MDRSGAREVRGRAPPPAAPLRIHLLGRFEVLRDGVPIPAQAWRRRRPSDLLKLVALSPERRVPRDRAIDTLWSEKDPASGANNLHRALYDLRLVLGGRYVEVEGAHVVLAPGAWLDVDAFEAAVAAGDADGRRLAVALYRGDLCPEDPESPWLQTRRRLLRTRFAEVAAPAAHEVAAQGDVAEAVVIARRLLEAEPASEQARHLLMELLAQGGNRDEALRAYDDAVRVGRAAGRPQPGEALRDLRAAIERREVGPAVTPAPADGVRRAALRLLGTASLPPLRGRAAQLKSAAAALDPGAGVLVLLGEPGVGKTRLALELARTAQERGAVVLAGVACSQYPGPPFAPFADAFRAEAHENPAAPPDPFAAEEGARALPPDAARLRLFRAVAAALAAAGGGRPVLLLLDDLHAADESSLSLLHFLARQTATLRLSIVGACRENAIRAGSAIQTALNHLDTDKLARGLRLPRLALSAGVELLGDLLPVSPAPDVATQFCQATDGNPFHLQQVARAWDEAGRGALPADAAAALDARLARVGGPGSAVLAAAAVIGPRASLDLVAGVAGVAPEDARAALRPACDAGLLWEEPRAVRFVHELVREAILVALDPARRAAIHGAVADLLEARAPSPGRPAPAPERLAWHRREAFQGDRAFRHLVASGHRAAARGGLREALGFHEAALAGLVEPGRPGEGPLQLELIDAVGRGRLGLGEIDGAVDAFRRAAAFAAGDGWRPPPELRARARRVAAMGLAVVGDLAGAEAELRLGLAEAGDAAGGDAAAEEAASLRLLAARLHWHAARFQPALDAAERCAAEAERLGHADLLANARDLAALSRAAGGLAAGPPVERSGRAERRRADAITDHLLDVPIVFWETSFSGDLPIAELLRLAHLEVDRCRERGDDGAAAAPLYATGAALLAAGDLDGAERSLSEALALHRAAGSAHGEAITLERMGALLNARGRIFEAMEALAEGVVVAERAPLRRHLLVRLHVAQARNRVAAGSLQAADVAAREALEAAQRHGACSTCDVLLRPLAVRIALARDRLDDAAGEAALLEALAASRGTRTLQATARMTRARVLGALGRKEQALALLADARATFEQLGRRYDIARCARAAARLGAPRDRALEAILPPDGTVID